MRHGWRETPLVLGTRLDGRGEVMLSAEDRRTHTYIAGATGSGKTKLLEQLIRQDIRTWRDHRCGMLLIDPHGSLYREVMRFCAAGSLKGVPIIPIDLTDESYVISYNVLRRRTTAQSAIVAAFVQAMAYVWGQATTDQTPRFERWAKGILNALYETGGTLSEAPRLLSLSDPQHRLNILPQLKGNTLEHWRSACRLAPKQFREEVESTLNRLQRFEECERLRLMFGVHGTSFDFLQAIEEGWIVLVNGSTEGAWGDAEDVDTLATLMLADLWTAAATRGKGSDKRPFRVVIDEFQRFMTPSIARNLAEARGFGLHLTLATQFPTQLLAEGQVGENIFRNVMGNARSKIVFAIEEPDSLKTLAEWLFIGSVDPDAIKDEVYGTRAIGQKVVTLRGHSTTETQSSSDGDSQVFNEDGEEVSTTTRSQGGVSTSSSTSRAETLATVYGQELSSRQFRSVEEQFFQAMQKVVQQDQRHAYVRTPSMKTPVAMRAMDVRASLARDPYVKEYGHKLVSKLPFALPVEEARGQIAARRAVLELGREVDEPMTSRRRIK